MWLNICNITFKRADVSGSEHIPLHPTSYISFSCLGLFFGGTGFERIFVWLRPFKWKANDCSTWAGKRVHSKHQTTVKQKQPDTHVHHNEKWWQTVYILKAGINSKYPPLSMTHFPVISVLDWISTKAAKHLLGSRCVAKGIPLAWPTCMASGRAPEWPYKPFQPGNICRRLLLCEQERLQSHIYPPLFWSQAYCVLQAYKCK